jgi:mono/diheme cytochrome c family protein
MQKAVLMLFGLLSPLALAAAVPVAANPVVVPAFDRALGRGENPEALRSGGLLLMAELNCTACHAAPEGWREHLAQQPAPDLSAVGARLPLDVLKKFVTQPHQHKPGTRMPAPPSAADQGSMEALFVFLQSLRGSGEAKGALLDGDRERGSALYHSVGCVACHEPEAAKVQNAVSGGGLSVPLALGVEYAGTALEHFLRAPLSFRPAGRMPAMGLSEQEAFDIAAYLRGGRPAAAVPAEAVTTKDSLRRGRAVFGEMGCSSCHALPGEVPGRKAAPLAGLVLDGGCLSEKPPGRAPRFPLDDLRRRALREGLRVVQSGEVQQWGAAAVADWELERLNCRACHSRGGSGGPEPWRAAFFGANDPGAESLGEMAHLPPRLDGVGRKLTRGWIQKLLWGEGGSVRPYMETRMPVFGEPAAGRLVEGLLDADRRTEPVAIDVTGLLGHQRSAIGMKLMGTTGLGCVSCHGLRDRKSLGPPVIRLTHTVERLQPEYFKELLLNPQATQPGTVMPPLLAGRASAAKDVESIWTYLRELQGQPLPEGLASDADYELKPAVEGRALILRSFVEGVGTHAVGVGFPEGVNAAFDAQDCRWATIWKGRFLDALSNYQERAMPPIRPLGTDVQALPPLAAGETGREFAGYRLDAKGVPTFLYRKDGVLWEDTLVPAPDGSKLTRVLKRTDTGIQTQEVITW